MSKRVHLPGTGIRRRAARDEAWADGQVVAVGSRDAVDAAAKLLGIDGVLCITPNGRLDGHGRFVDIEPRAGKRRPVIRCSFCKELI